MVSYLGCPDFGTHSELYFSLMLNNNVIKANVYKLFRTQDSLNPEVI